MSSTADAQAPSGNAPRAQRGTRVFLAGWLQCGLGSIVNNFARGRFFSTSNATPSHKESSSKAKRTPTWNSQAVSNPLGAPRGTGVLAVHRQRRGVQGTTPESTSTRSFRHAAVSLRGFSQRHWQYLGRGSLPHLRSSGHALQQLHGARPNPSFKRSANGRPPGPVWRYAVHFRQSGPGVLPLAPA